MALEYSLDWCREQTDEAIDALIEKRRKGELTPLVLGPSKSWDEPTQATPLQDMKAPALFSRER